MCSRIVRAHVTLSRLGGHRTVQAGQDWLGSGVTVSRGQKVFVDATGTLSNGFDANGMFAFGGASFDLVNFPVSALHGRMADQEFYLGGANALLAPAAGEVELFASNAS